MLGHSEQMYDFVFGSGDGAEGAAELNHYPVFSDHNDFLFGEAGNDEIYGGSGGDYMIGGQGADSMEGGTGDDQIYGDGPDESGGLPDGDLNHAGDDVTAGAVRKHGIELSGGAGGPRPTRAGQGGG